MQRLDDMTREELIAKIHRLDKHWGDTIIALEKKSQERDALEAENDRLLHSHSSLHRQLKIQLDARNEARHWARRLKRESISQQQRLQKLGELAEAVNVLVSLQPDSVYWWGKDMIDFIKHLQEKAMRNEPN